LSLTPERVECVRGGGYSDHAGVLLGAQSFGRILQIELEAGMAGDGLILDGDFGPVEGFGDAERSSRTLCGEPAFRRPVAG
jgi:hypothetical protein